MFGWVPVTLKSAKGSHTSLPKLEASAVANKFKKEDNLDKKFVQLTLFVSQTSQENAFTILPDFKSSIQGLYKTPIQKIRLFVFKVIVSVRNGLKSYFHRYR